jgi:hypothetical protein
MGEVAFLLKKYRKGCDKLRMRRCVKGRMAFFKRIVVVGTDFAKGFGGWKSKGATNVSRKSSNNTTQLLAYILWKAQTVLQTREMEILCPRAG